MLVGSIKRAAIEHAKKLIEARSSKGQTKDGLIGQFGVPRNEAGRLIQIALRELYDPDGITDPWHWFAMDVGKSTSLQRRFARQKWRQYCHKIDAEALLARYRQMKALAP